MRWLALLLALGAGRTQEDDARRPTAPVAGAPGAAGLEDVVARSFAPEADARVGGHAVRLLNDTAWARVRRRRALVRRIVRFCVGLLHSPQDITPVKRHGFLLWRCLYVIA